MYDAKFEVDTEDNPVLKLFKDQQPFENLVQAPPQELLHYRNERKNAFKGRVKKTSFKILYDGKEVAVVSQYDDRNSATALVSGKKKEIRVGKKMKDRSQYPLSLTLPEYNLKIQSSLAVENDAFILYVNSVNFLTLPYKYDMTKERDP